MSRALPILLLPLLLLSCFHDLPVSEDGSRMDAHLDTIVDRSPGGDSLPPRFDLVNRGIDEELRDVWGINQALWIVGTNGLVLHRASDATWSNPIRITYAKTLTGIWSSDPVWITEDLGTEGRILKSTATGWEIAGTFPRDLFGIWGSAADDVWAVGDELLILRSDGKSWTTSHSPVAGQEDLQAVWGAGGEVWAVGQGGVILHRADGKWASEHADATIQRLHGVWGSSKEDVWAVGTGGVILRRKGWTWAKHPKSPTTFALRDVMGCGASDIWAVGQGGTILHFDGVEWAKVAGPTTQTLLSVWCGGTSEVWAVGQKGAILHHAP